MDRYGLVRKQASKRLATFPCRDFSRWRDAGCPVTGPNPPGGQGIAVHAGRCPAYREGCDGDAAGVPSPPSYSDTAARPVVAWTGTVAFIPAGAAAGVLPGESGLARWLVQRDGTRAAGRRPERPVVTGTGAFIPAGAACTCSPARAEWRGGS